MIFLLLKEGSRAQKTDIDAKNTKKSNTKNRKRISMFNFFLNIPSKAHNKKITTIATRIIGKSTPIAGLRAKLKGIRNRKARKKLNHIFLFSLRYHSQGV